MELRSLVSIATAVDPTGVAPSRVLADIGAVRSRGLVILVKNGRPVVRCCRGIVVSLPMFVTSMPSICTVSDSKHNDDDMVWGWPDVVADFLATWSIGNLGAHVREFGLHL